MANVPESKRPRSGAQRRHGTRGLLHRSAPPGARSAAARGAANPEFDVLLCAQNLPASIDIGPVTTAQSAGVGRATVSTYWNGGSDKADFTAYVDLDATRPIQLLDVDCGFEG
ncbi:hypothetical protein [Streptomyces coeruleorubidus]|uniref:hypothetical protein n=1 Tax=Streptomyces coeruleorubidus TaxID=116188 RepID=UPI00368AD8CF